MKILAQEEEQSVDNFSYHGHPLAEKPSLFAQMTLGKRVAWHVIYNDYMKRLSQE
jgi:hypothetical protein